MQEISGIGTLIFRAGGDPLGPRDPSQRRYLADTGAGSGQGHGPGGHIQVSSSVL